MALLILWCIGIHALGHSHSVHMHGVSFSFLETLKPLKQVLPSPALDGCITIFVYWHSRKFCLGGKAEQFPVYTKVICLRASTCLAQADFSLVQGGQI